MLLPAPATVLHRSIVLNSIKLKYIVSLSIFILASRSAGKALPLPNREILNKLGTVRNQLLIFAVIAALIITGFSMPLTYRNEQWMRVCGVVMHFVTVLMLLSAAAFYVYAYFCLAPSEQALEFASVAAAQVVEHRERLGEVAEFVE
jgi:hypothetical protein